MAALRWRVSQDSPSKPLFNRKFRVWPRLIYDSCRNIGVGDKSLASIIVRAYKAE